LLHRKPRHARERVADELHARFRRSLILEDPKASVGPLWPPNLHQALLACKRNSVLKVSHRSRYCLSYKPVY
jgi:hypothetical protein